MSRMARQTSFQIFERSPLIPSRGPALLMSWQLKPADRLSMSYWPATAAQSMTVRSPRFTAPGNRAAMTLAAAGSFSA